MGYRTVMNDMGEWVLEWVPDEEPPPQPQTQTPKPSDIYDTGYTPEQYSPTPKPSEVYDTGYTPEQWIPKTQDWIRTLPSPQQEATGTIGGAQTTARETQPLSALDIPTYETPQLPQTASDWLRQQNEQQQIAQQAARYQPEWPEMEISPELAQKATAVKETWDTGELVGDSEVSQNLLDVIGNWIFGTVSKPAEAQTPKGTPEEESNLAELTKEIYAPINRNAPQQTITPDLVKKQFEILGRRVAKLSAADQKAEVADTWKDIVTTISKVGDPANFVSDPEVHQAIVEQMLINDKASPKWVESLPPDQLSGTLTKIAGYNPDKLPKSISDAYLDAIPPKNELAMAQLWDLGYKGTKLTKDTNDVLTKFNTMSQGKVSFNPEQLNGVKYMNMKALVSYLQQMPQEQWQKLAENNGRMVLKTTQTGFDALGNPVFNAVWDTVYPPDSKLTQSDKDKWIDQQRFQYEWYWSPEAVAQRQKEREESWEFSHQKELEGWGSYYNFLDAKKMYPDMNDFYKSPAMFAELRRRWETTGGGVDWETWLANYDFDENWYTKRPTERGEKPSYYKSRIRRVSY